MPTARRLYCDIFVPATSTMMSGAAQPRASVAPPCAEPPSEKKLVRCGTASICLPGMVVRSGGCTPNNLANDLNLDYICANDLRPKRSRSDNFCTNYYSELVLCANDLSSAPTTSAVKIALPTTSTPATERIHRTAAICITAVLCVPDR